MQQIKWLINFIKKYWREVLLVIFSIALLFYFTREPKVKIIQTDNSDLYKEIKTLKDRNGDLVVQTTQSKLDKNEFQQRVDSLAYELSLKSKNIKTVDRWNIKIDSQFYLKSVPVYYNKDTAYKVSQIDSWLTAVAIVGKDTGYIHVSLKDTLDRVETNRSKFIGFIGSNKTDVLMRAKSPYTTFESGYSFTVKSPTEIIVIGPSLTYDLFNKKVIVGVSATIPLIKIHKP